MQYPPYWQIFPCDSAIKFGLEVVGQVEMGWKVLVLIDGRKVVGLNDGQAVLGFTEGHAVVGFTEGEIDEGRTVGQ